MKAITLTQDGTTEPLSIHLPQNVVVGQILERLRQAGLAAPDGLFLYRDDHDDCMAEDLSIDLDALSEILHVARRKQVMVTVNWQSQSLIQKFAPSVRVRRIRREAISYFKIAPADASKLVLVATGSTEPLDVTARIGSISQDCALSLDLVPHEKIQG